MHYPVIIQTHSGHCVAEPLGKPDLRVEAATEPEALEQVGKLLKRWLSAAKLVQLEVLTNGGNPWLEAFGDSANDPDFDEYLEEIARARAAEDAR